MGHRHEVKQDESQSAIKMGNYCILFMIEEVK